MSAICARLTNKGKAGVQRGRETAGVPSSLPPRRVPRRSRRPQTANSPLRFSEKLSARQGRTRLRQFAHPGFPVQKKSRPSGANPPAAVRAPRLSGAEKEPPVRGEPPAQFVYPAQPVPRKTTVCACFWVKKERQKKTSAFYTKIYLTFCEKSWYNKTLYKIGYIIRFLSIC